MNKIKLLFTPALLSLLILYFASCGVTKDINIGLEYPNLVKQNPFEIKVGEKFKFRVDDKYNYLIIIQEANEFLDIDSVNLIVGVDWLNKISKPFLVENKGTGEYFFKVFCVEREIWSKELPRIIIKSE